MFLNANFNDYIFDFLRDNDFFLNSTDVDTNPIVCCKKENDYIIGVKTLGIDKNDINVKLEKNILLVSGESKNKYSDKPFNANIKVKLQKEFLNDIESIDYTSKDGITYVFIRMKETHSDRIKINKI